MIYSAKIVNSLQTLFIFPQKTCKIAGNVVSLQKESINISDYAAKEV